MKVLVTGGSGFIGRHVVRSLLARPGVSVVNLDALTYAADPAFRPTHSGYQFAHGNVTDPAAVRWAMAGCTHVLHLAAESHVDRSIADAAPFLLTNVVGTHVLLDEARRAGVIRFVQVSTDEVYGDLPAAAPPSKPGDLLKPSSPYAASKAAADLLALAYHRTHGLPVVVTRCTNNYGPGQHPEKLIPMAITRLLAGQPVPVYGDGLQRRDWLHVADHCEGLWLALTRGEAGRVYHFGGGVEWANRDLLAALCGLCGVSPTLLTPVPDRPGHDRRYALDATATREAWGWRPAVAMAPALGELVAWHRAKGAA